MPSNVIRGIEGRGGHLSSPNRVGYKFTSKGDMWTSW